MEMVFGAAVVMSVGIRLDRSHRDLYDYGWALPYIPLLLAIGLLSWLRRGRPLTPPSLLAMELFLLTIAIRAGAGFVRYLWPRVAGW